MSVIASKSEIFLDCRNWPASEPYKITPGYRLQDGSELIVAINEKQIIVPLPDGVGLFDVTSRCGQWYGQVEIIESDGNRLFLCGKLNHRQSKSSEPRDCL